MRPTPTERIATIQRRLRERRLERELAVARRKRTNVLIPKNCPLCKNDPKKRTKPWCQRCYKLPSER